MILIILFLLTGPASAREWGDLEGRIYNKSEETLICWRDSACGELITYQVPIGSFCLGDAVSDTDYERFFKVPNKSKFKCTKKGCFPTSIESSLRFKGASFKNGADHYGWMSESQFKRLMGVQ